MSTDLMKEVRLRRDAESKITSGTAPPAGGWAVSVDALAMLYRLSSSPETADDALKLLNELQVHQIELCMQQEQLEAVERETAETLSYYQELYEMAPVPYFVIDQSGIIIDANRAGAGLFGGHREGFIGRPLETFLTPESGTPARALLTLLRGNDDSGVAVVRLAPAGITARLAVSTPPSGGFGMVVVSPLEDPAEP